MQLNMLGDVASVYHQFGKPMEVLSPMAVEYWKIVFSTAGINIIFFFTEGHLVGKGQARVVNIILPGLLKSDSKRVLFLMTL